MYSVGSQYYEYIILHISEPDPRGRRFATVECRCGHLEKMRFDNIKSKTAKKKCNHQSKKISGDLELIEKIPARQKSGAIKYFGKFSCKCDPSKIIMRRIDSVFKKNGPTHCGCKTDRTGIGGAPTKTEPKKSLIGEKFGELCVIEFAGKIGDKKRNYWKCTCSCGNDAIVRGDHLNSGNSTHCGCKSQRPPGRQPIMDRREAIARKNFTRQRGRSNKGINTKIKFWQFFEISKWPCDYCGGYNSYTDKLTGKDYSLVTLDRIDSNGDYELSNVVPCCNICNTMKMNLTTSKFRRMINSIYKHNYKNEKIEWSTIDTKQGRIKESVSRIYSSCKSSAKKRGLDFEISTAVVHDKIRQECEYCAGFSYRVVDSGQEIKFNGIDRVDSRIGYIESNIVSACKSCNLAKNTLSREGFLEHVLKIKNHLDRQCTIYPTSKRGIFAIES